MSILDNLDMDHLIATAREAGAAIMGVYQTEFDVARKSDTSPLTQADLQSHDAIARGLAAKYPATPILSEESGEHASYEVRKGWDEFWLVDPLDGTKEFVKRNGQFTVNIALIEHSRPMAGVVYAPALEVLYYADARRGAFKVQGGREPLRLSGPIPSDGEKLVIAGSLSHPTAEMQQFVAGQRRKYKEVQFVAMGSSIKICMVADGQADIYPRLGPTMEWDTAAAHAVANGAGRKVLRYPTDEELRYNKENLLNDWFVVQ